MEYLNANDVLPQNLLKEIQKYADGTLLYIPKVEGKEKTWGELSGQKLYYRKRNRVFSDGLYKKDRFYLGPLAMSLDLFQRNCGPEEDMKWQVNEEVFELRVDDWMERIDLKQTLPPIIVGYEAGRFEINCNSPLFEALIRKEVVYYPMIVWCSSEEDYDEFRSKYVAYTEFALN